MSARAHGWISSGFKSAAMLREYLGEILVHSPDRSGLSSSVRGAGAARFGLPSGVRGKPGVEWCSHCAPSGTLKATVTTAINEAFMTRPPHRLRTAATTGDRRAEDTRAARLLLEVEQR